MNNIDVQRRMGLAEKLIAFLRRLRNRTEPSPAPESGFVSNHFVAAPQEADPKPPLEQVRRAERSGDWVEVERLCRQLLAEREVTAWIWRSLAITLRKQGRHDEAEAAVQEGIKHYPGNFGLAPEEAKLSETKQDWNEAARRWGSVTSRWPQAPDGPVGEANALRRQGALATAEQVVDEALGRMPGVPVLHDAHGLNAMAKKDWPKALARFETARKVFQTDERFSKRIADVQARSEAENRKLAKRTSE